MMFFSHRGSKVLIVGGSGCGKTTQYLRRIQESKARFKFIFDPDCEAAIRLNAPMARTLAELAEATERGLVVYDYSAMFPGERDRGFRFFADYVYTFSTRSKGLKLFCCDELQRFIGPRDDQLPRELRLILEEGRRAKLDSIFVAQSANITNTRLRNQLTEVVFFRQIDPRALKFAEDLGFNPEKVAALKPGQFLVYYADTGKYFEGKEF